MDKLEIKKSTLIAAYLICTAYFMGAVSAVGPYACPSDHGWQRVGITLFAGVAWPFVQGVTILGYTSHATKCLSGSPYIWATEDR